LNAIQTGAFNSVISGGNENTITTNADISTIGGGQLNQILAGANFSTISGGGDNVIAAGGATVGEAAIGKTRTSVGEAESHRALKVRFDGTAVVAGANATSTQTMT
jgi:hypothetical protein